MEVVTAIAATTGKVAEYMVAPIGRQLGYLFCYGRNLNELSKKAEKIEEAKESTQHLVDAARNNGEEIERGALNWMRRVDEIYGHAKSLQAYAGHARAGCTSWSCPNLWSRHQLSRLAKKMSETIDAILGEKNLCEKISYRTAPKWIEKASITAGYMSFESRDMILNEIMEALKDPDINMIGVYGLGGVGKTTLVKDIARKAQEDKVFDVVAMSIVKHEQEVAKIQKEIAEMLGMKIEEESEFIRADRLHNRLKQEKNVLVILDDLWVGIDLSKIGIPFGSKQKGCKVLLTSRNQEVLSNQMDTQKDFFLGVLPKEEAWKLFKEMAGLEDLKENSEFLFTTAEVAEKCAGLPIALVTVGRALRNKSLSEWRDALRQLQSPTSRNISRLQEIVDNSIKLSFDYLESEELKNTFLLCAIGMGSNIAFTDLLKYSVGMRLFRGIYTIEAVRDRLNTLIGKLKARLPVARQLF
ncbi:Disease resistance protein [Quillaja saponaria]|uniref:Disease resistance protein n=1 Tax=Quillaja saponaria TaxID=32244 RepID=A0AAD7KPT6_QUISA|nr:Disease resistance protein [Quillaja saponaria]